MMCCWFVGIFCIDPPGQTYSIKMCSCGSRRYSGTVRGSHEGGSRLVAVTVAARPDATDQMAQKKHRASERKRKKKRSEKYVNQ